MSEEEHINKLDHAFMAGYAVGYMERKKGQKYAPSMMLTRWRTETCSMVRLRKPLEEFADVMELQLRANDHKGEEGWVSDIPAALMCRLHEEIRELNDVLVYHPKDTERIVKEAADVTNFAMMIADVQAIYFPRTK